MLRLLQNEFKKFIFFRHLNFEREFWTLRIGLTRSGNGNALVMTSWIVPFGFGIGLIRHTQTQASVLPNEGRR